jgi:hypothetical protein
MALSKFGSAFAEARKAGEKVFTFNGKKYTTEMADDKPRSVGGTPVAGEYKTRAPYSDRGNAMTEKNAVRRDLNARMKEVESENQNDELIGMRNVARDKYDRQGQEETSENYKPRYTPPTQAPKPTTSERPAKPFRSLDPDETFKKGGSVSSASRRADGIATKGKTKGRFV